MELVAPKGFSYEGRSLSAQHSADGTIFWTAALRPEGSQQAVHKLLHQRNAGEPSVIVDLPVQVQHGVLELTPKGLYFAGPDNNGKPVFVEVPGYVAYAVFVPLGVGRTAETVAQNAERLANEALNKAGGVVQKLDGFEQHLADIAWAKAGDRITAWWNGMVDYKTPQLLNLIHNRVRAFAIRNHLAQVTDLGAVVEIDENDVSENKPETIRM